VTLAVFRRTSQIEEPIPFEMEEATDGEKVHNIMRQAGPAVMISIVLVMVPSMFSQLAVVGVIVAYMWACAESAPSSGYSLKLPGRIVLLLDGWAAVADVIFDHMDLGAGPERMFPLWFAAAIIGALSFLGFVTALFAALWKNYATKHR
jgi:hypothetical protein